MSLTVWITANCGKFFKRWEYQTTLPASWETCMQVKKQQIELNMENGLVQNWKEVCQGCILYPAYLSYMQRTSWEMLGSRKQSWNQVCWEKYNNLRYGDDTTLMAESEEELKSFLMKVKEESEKVGLKLKFRKLRSWHLAASLHSNRWGNSGNSVRLYFLGLQNHCRWWLQPWN